MNLASKISQLIDLSSEARAWLQENVESFSFKKNEEILPMGKVCRHLYFVHSGLLCGSYVDDGKEVSNWLATNGDFATSFYSFITGKSSPEAIICLENCKAEAITIDKLNEMYHLFPESERAGRLILEDYYARLEEHFISLRSKSAKERYQSLHKSRPDLVLHAPLGRIASYLGMSQETLSRIRAEAD